MRVLFLLALGVGGVLIVATPLGAANLLKIWPASLFYAGGVVIYLAILWAFIVWRRRKSSARGSAPV